MSLEISRLGPAALEMEIGGALHADDYKTFVPLAEASIREHGKVSLLVRASDFRGITPAALWHDLKFDIAHYSDVARLAIVARDSSKDWLIKLSEPFTAAEVKYFSESDIDAARDWVRGEATDTEAP